MTLDVLLALFGYAFVSSVTPGPNNMMLMASGVNFGFVRTIPHMLGIGIGVGFVALLLAVGFGLGALVHAFPALETALKVASVAYLLWLAWTLAMSRSLGEVEGTRRPLTLLEAAAFQWINPKAWAMALVAMGAYADQSTPSVILVAAAFGAVNLPSVSIWAGFGVALRGLLADPVWLRRFNIAMAVALVATTLPLLR